LFILVLATMVVAVVLAGLLWRHRGNFSHPQRLSLAAAFVAFAFTLVGPIYWSPTYDKLWLQPIAALVLLAGLALAALPPSRGRRTATVGCMALVVLELVSNSCWVIPNLNRETPYLREARLVDEILRSNDLLISEWDGVSQLYGALYGFGRPQLCLPTAAHERGALVLDDLREMVRQAESRRARVFFLGVMDHTEASWKAFLGARLHVPYQALDEFRLRCRPVATFQVNGKDLTLQLLEPPSTGMDPLG
jgi:hypothetical protein